MKWITRENDTAIGINLLALAILAPQASPLTTAAEIPLPGATNRFDYQSIDETTGRLFLSHMGDGHLVVVDLERDKVIADLPNYPTITGVLAVPEEGKVYGSAAGSREVIVTDLRTLRVRARLKGADFPDGIAYAPNQRRVFVSDESGGIDLVIDAKTDKVVAKVNLGGEAGNTHYDATGKRILVAVQSKNQMAAIDPSSLRITCFPLPGSDHPHGFYVDDGAERAYISCEGNAKLLVVDLTSMKVLQSLNVGEGPDVLAFDKSLHRLYVACESGVLNIFGERRGKLAALGEVRAPHAHTVSVDQKTHKVYLALMDVGGKPMLRVLIPAQGSQK